MDETYNGVIRAASVREASEPSLGGSDSANNAGLSAISSKTDWSNSIKESLPSGYNLASAYVADSFQRFSDLFDVVIYEERENSYKFNFHGSIVIPVELTCVVFETCDLLEPGVIVNFEKKVAKLRRLISLDEGAVPYGGTAGSGVFNFVRAGILASGGESDLIKEVDSLAESISCESDVKIDVGCVANIGTISKLEPSGFMISRRRDPLSEFLKELAENLQLRNSTSHTDLKAYGSWLGIG